jgi:hypothetical protein
VSRSARSNDGAKLRRRNQARPSAIFCANGLLLHQQQDQGSWPGSGSGRNHDRVKAGRRYFAPAGRKKAKNILFSGSFDELEAKTQANF